MLTLGVVGLGSMGLGAALSALRRGVPTWGCDPRDEVRERFAGAGGQPAATPAALAPHCDAVLVLVVNAAQTEEVLFGAEGLAPHLRRGAVVICSATVDPSLPPAWEARLAASGLWLIDAPGLRRPEEGRRRADDDDGLGPPGGIRGRGHAARRHRRQGVAARRRGRHRLHREDGQPAPGRRAHRRRLRGDGARPARRRRPAPALRRDLRLGRHELDVREPRAAHPGRRLPAAVGGEHLRQGPRHRARRMRASCTLPLPLASAAHQMYLQAAAAGPRRRGRQRGDQDLPGDPAGQRQAQAGGSA